MRLSKIFFTLLFLAACTYNAGSGMKEAVDDTSQSSSGENGPMTLSIVDPATDKKHRLTISSIKLNNGRISGYSEVSGQMEIFNLSPGDKQFFDLMKKKKGLEAAEVQCLQCHQARDNELYLKKD